MSKPHGMLRYSKVEQYYALLPPETTGEADSGDLEYIKSDCDGK